MSEADKKALKVKAGVVKRLAKEMAMYEQEVAAEQAKVQRLKDSGADPHDIKYAVSGGPSKTRSATADCRAALGQCSVPECCIKQQECADHSETSSDCRRRRRPPTTAAHHPVRAGEHPGRVKRHATRHAATIGGSFDGSAGAGGECY